MSGITAYGNEHLVYLFFPVLFLAALFVWAYHDQKAKMDAFAHGDSMKKIAESLWMPGRVSKRVLACLAYLLLVFALVRPQGNPDQVLEASENDAPPPSVSASFSLEEIENTEKGERVKVRESAKDILFLLDVSASMAAPDLYPDRLEKAKYLIRDILSCLDGEHVGLVLFTSVPSVKCVLTLDHTYFKEVLESVVINDNDYAGTQFMPALKEIVDRQFDFSENKHKELIIITDGGDTTLEVLEGKERASFEKALFDLTKKAFEEKGIRVHTIGLGAKGGAIIPGVRDEKGNPVRSTLNETLLKGISHNAKGVYVAVEDSMVNMTEIYKTHIAPEEKMDIEKEMRMDPDKLKELVQKQNEEEEQKVVYEEYYLYPLFLAILIMIGEFFIPERKRAGRRSE